MKCAIGSNYHTAVISNVIDTRPMEAETNHHHRKQRGDVGWIPIHISVTESSWHWWDLTASLLWEQKHKTQRKRWIVPSIHSLYSSSQHLPLAIGDGTVFFYLRNRVLGLKVSIGTIFGYFRLYLVVPLLSCSVLLHSIISLFPVIVVFFYAVSKTYTMNLGQGGPT